MDKLDLIFDKALKGYESRLEDFVSNLKRERVSFKPTSPFIPFPHMSFVNRRFVSWTPRSGCYTPEGKSEKEMFEKYTQPDGTFQQVYPEGVIKYSK